MSCLSFWRRSHSQKSCRHPLMLALPGAQPWGPRLRRRRKSCLSWSWRRMRRARQRWMRQVHSVGWWMNQGGGRVAWAVPHGVLFGWAATNRLCFTACPVHAHCVVRHRTRGLLPCAMLCTPSHSHPAFGALLRPLCAGEEQLTLAQEAEGDGAQPPVAAATQLDEEEEERRLLAMAADDEGAEEMGPPSTINLPAGTSTAAASLPRHPAHGTMAEQAPDSEDQALLQMLDAQLLPSQPGGGSAAGAHAMDIAAQAEEAPHQLQASPLLGAGTEEQPSVWTVADGAEAEDVSVSAAREAAAAMEPSLVLGTGTEEQAMAFEPSPLLGECTEEQLPIDGQAHFVPETEQQPRTQEL